MKPNPWQMAILVAVVIITVFATRKYDEWTTPEPEPQDVMVGSDSLRYYQILADSLIRILELTHIDTSDNTGVYSYEFSADTSYSGVSFGISGVVTIWSSRLPDKVQLTTRKMEVSSTITGTLWKLADGSNRITLRGGEGVRLSKREFTWDSEKKHWYDWIKPQISLFSLVSMDNGIVGLDLGWGEEKLSVMLGSNGEKPINYVGVRWRIYP